MATIIRTSQKSGIDRGSAFNFDDMAVQASRYLEEVRQQAESILAQATSEADRIRTRAEAAGQQAAEQNAERVLEARIAETLLPALTKVAAEIAQAKDTWVAEWERQLVQLATAIAAKVVRREIQQQPDITLELVRESLALATGSPRLTVRLSEADFGTLGSQVEQLAAHIGNIGSAHVVADKSITSGGCRVDSEFGVIDQQIETQLARIAEELV